MMSLEPQDSLLRSLMSHYSTYYDIDGPDHRMSSNNLVVSDSEKDKQSSCRHEETVCTPPQSPPPPPSLPSQKGYQYTEKLLLPEDFQPSAYSVICGRGRKAIDSVGNRRLAVTASLFANRYAGAKNKDHKSVIVSEILEIVRSACEPNPQNAFVKYRDGRWYRVETLHAREKIGTVLRDVLHSKYKSSTKSKVRQRIIRKRNAMKTARKAVHQVTI